MAESEEELKSLLMKVKVESEKVGLKLNIWETKIIASGPITSWEIDGETVETVSDFILGDSQITEDGDCSHEIKRHLLLGRKVTLVAQMVKNQLPTPVFCLDNSMDTGAWWTTVHGTLKSLLQNHSSKHQIFGAQLSSQSNFNIHT